MSQATTLLSISEIFQNRFFLIPDYQRGYSWEEEQLRDLREDIENLYSKDYKHFTGTIVAAKSSNDNNLFEIVDGQQRLTTLIILLKEVYNTDKQKYSPLIQLFFSRGTTGNERHVLEPNEETRTFFNDLIIENRSPIPKVKSHVCIIGAQRFFRKWLSETTENIDKIYSVVVEKLGFILFTPENEKEIGIMFEVINNRGKKLSELEKIKNYFIYFATVHSKDTLRKTINDKWREIQENLSISGKTSNEEENSFIRFCYLVFYEPNKEKSQTVYEQMKLNYSPHETDGTTINDQVEQLKDFVCFVANASRYYTYFFKAGEFLSYHTGSDKQLKRIDKALTYLRCQPVNASIMPLYIAVMNSFNQPQPSGQNDLLCRVADLLELLEIVNFRLYILPGVFNRADSRQGDMFFFANEFYNYPDWETDPIEKIAPRFNPHKIHNGNIYDWLELELKEMILSQCPVKKFVEVLTLESDEDYDYYNWRDGLRYFLSCYEEKMKADNKSDYNIERMLKLRNEVQDTPNEYLSIEHIWARKNLVEKYPENQLEKRRLGNLVLMGLSANQSQQNHSILEKIQTLTQENHISRGSLDLLQIDELKECERIAKAHPRIRGYSNKTHKYFRELAIALCDYRETKLIKFALERWKLNGEKTDSFLCVDTFNAMSNKIPYNYQFDNDSFSKH